MPLEFTAGQSQILLGRSVPLQQNPCRLSIDSSSTRDLELPWLSKVKLNGLFGKLVIRRNISSPPIT